MFDAFDEEKLNTQIRKNYYAQNASLFWWGVRFTILALSSLGRFLEKSDKKEEPKN